MKDLSLLVWLSQLGLSVALPPALFILLAVWLRSSCGWDNWVIWVGIVLGIYCAVTGFISSLRTLSRVIKADEKDKPPVSFNNHE